MKESIKKRIETVRRGEMPEGYRRAKLGIVPTGWEEKVLGDILTQRKTLMCVSEEAPLLSFTIEEGVIDPKDKKSNKRDFLIKDMATKKFALTEVGDIIYNPANLKFGAIHRNDLKRGVVSPIYGIFYGAPNSEFMGYFLHDQRFIDYAKTYTEGSVEKLKTLSADAFLKLKVTTPSLPEQEKIAEILATCDRVIELKRQLLKEKKKAFQYIMKLIFNGSSGYKELGKIAKITMGQSPDSSSYNTDEDGVPFLQGNADIVNGFPAPRYYTNQPTKMCVPGDLLLSVRAPVGEVSRSDRSACIGRGLCSIRAGKFTDYVYYYLRHYEPEWNKISQGSTFTAISGDDIKKVKVPMTDNTTLEHHVSSLRCADNEIRLLTKELSAWQQKKKALMQLLLTGLVRTKC